MDLSIVVVNWNTIDLLRDCLDSVFAGIGDVETEVIVIDNASEDGSQDMVVQLFPQARLIRNAENRGFAAANNQGFEVATGRHVLLLNSDTVVHGDVLAKSVAYLDANPAVGVMGCRVLNTDGTFQATCSEFPSLLNLFILATGLWKLKYPRWFGKYLMTDWQRDSERPVDVVTGCYLLVRHNIIKDLGGLDEAFFFFGEETDWCRRIREAGWKVMFAPVGEITHHHSASARKLNHQRDVLLATAFVKLHRKHNGEAAAIACWFISALFNGSRAIYWPLAALIDPSPRARERAVHFRRVFVNLGQALKR